MHDPQYELWVKENHPGSSDADSMKTHISKSVSTVSSDDLSEILKYPEAKVTSKLKKLAVNSTSTGDDEAVGGVSDDDEAVEGVSDDDDALAEASLEGLKIAAGVNILSLTSLGLMVKSHSS